MKNKSQFIELFLFSVKAIEAEARKRRLYMLLNITLKNSISRSHLIKFYGLQSTFIVEVNFIFLAVDVEQHIVIKE